MRIRHVASIADLIRADAAAVAAEYLSIRDAIAHEFRDEDERSRYLALVRAWGQFAHARRFAAALGEAETSVSAAAALVKPVCRECGGGNLARDASARWDFDAQDWLASGVYDSTSCDDCESESDTLCRWVPVDPFAVGAA